jgi:glycosyltransferase involved in cell wall biosynthesis
MSESPAELPLVSVVIPAYNAAATLPASIESVLAQRYPRVEVVVVDDGSTDRTPEVLRSFGDRIRWVYQENGGLPTARNTGHRTATGDLIAWLDADDLAEPDRIALQVDFLLQHPEIVLVGTDFSAFRDSGVVASRFAAIYYNQIADAENGVDTLYDRRSTFVPTRREWLQDSWDGISMLQGNVWSRIVWGNFVHPPTVMFRRSLLERIGGLDPSAAPEGDWDFFIRVSKEGELGHLETPLLRYRLSPGQMSGPTNAKASLLGQVYILRKTHSPSPSWPDRLRELWRERHALLYARLARAEAEQNSWAALGYLSLAAAHRHPPHSLIPIFILILLPVWAGRGLLALRRGMRRWIRRPENAPHTVLLFICALQQLDWVPAIT